MKWYPYLVMSIDPDQSLLKKHATSPLSFQSISASDTDNSIQLADDCVAKSDVAIT